MKIYKSKKGARKFKDGKEKPRRVSYQEHLRSLKSRLKLRKKLKPPTRKFKDGKDITQSEANKRSGLYHTFPREYKAYKKK